MDKKYKILMVDDDKFLLDIYSKKIQDIGLEIETLEYPTKDFVQTVLNIKPDLIALDIIMPEIDGFQAIKMLKSDPRTKDVPVIFETNLGQPEDIEKGMALGPVDYIVIAYFTPSDIVQCYLDYLEDPQRYIQRYPIFREVAKTKFLGNNFEEQSKKRDAFVEKKMIELGIKS